MTLTLDIHCKPCGRPGRVGPRMARFTRDPGKPIQVVRHRLVTTGEQPYVYDTRAPEPYSHDRQDGGRTWHLGCGCGHTRRVKEERLWAALDTITPDEAGNGILRVSL